MSNQYTPGQWVEGDTRPLSPEDGEEEEVGLAEPGMDGQEEKQLAMLDSVVFWQKIILAGIGVICVLSLIIIFRM